MSGIVVFKKLKSWFLGSTIESMINTRNLISAGGKKNVHG